MPTTPTGKRLSRSASGTEGRVSGPITVSDFTDIEAEARQQERDRLRARLGSHGWLRLPDGIAATVEHVLSDDCECAGLGCVLDIQSPGELAAERRFADESLKG